MTASVHAGHRARLRQRAQKETLGAFQPHEALELLLFHPIPQRDVNPLAHALIDRFGSLRGVLCASREELSGVPGVGERTVSFLGDVRDAVQRYGSLGPDDRPRLDSLPDLKAWFARTCANEEGLYLLSLNLAGHLLGVSRVCSGDWRGRIRLLQLADPAVRYRAQGVVLICARPVPGITGDDVELARRAVRLFSQMRISLVDSVVFSGGGADSMVQSGILRRRAPGGPR